MKILLVTNHLYPTGGDWTYVSSVAKLYRSYGHEVYLFGKKDNRNLDQTYESFYVEGITEYDKRNKLVYAFNILKKNIYSFESYSKMGKFLDSFPIDIVQLNNINIGLTPSIVNAIKERNIPIVWRILDYKIICPTIYLRCGTEICESCKGGRYFNCIKKRCKNNSYFDSMIVALETWFYSHRNEYNKVDMFSFQNDFMRRKFIEWGFDENKTISINNPYDVSTVKPNESIGKFVLYFGRLDKPKGVMTLLETAKINRDIKYVIVGKGDEENKIVEEIKNNNLNNVVFRGPVWGDEMEAIIEDSKFVVVPSEWHEPSPYVVLQSFAHAKPVVGSNIGGLPEMITDGEDGFLFTAGDYKELANKIRDLYFDDLLVISMGKNARRKVETKFSPKCYYDATIELLDKLIDNKK